MTTYTPNEFRAYFAKHYARRIAALFDTKTRKVDLTDAGNIARVLEQFDAIWNLGDAPPLAVPKHIWMLWQQGWDVAPDIVKRCARSWQEQNPGWEVHLLDDRTLSETAPSYDDIPKGKAWRSALSNMARVSLLMEHGGVWADATIFCSRPLDDWLRGAARTGLFFFDSPRPYRPISSWFIASSTDNYVLRAMREIYAQYWGYFERAHHYFWMHYLFVYLMERDPRVRAAWNAVPKIPAHGQFIVERNAFNREAAPIVNEIIDKRLVPMHKLSHKWKFDGSLEGTPLGRLTGLAHL